MRKLPKDELIENINHCLKRVTNANDCLQLYRILNKECRELWLEEMNLAPAFFQVIMRSLHYSCMIETAKLFDNSGKSMSIGTLLDESKCNSEFFLTEVTEVYHSVDANRKDEHFTILLNPLNDIYNAEVELAKLDFKIKNLRERRNKYYAHTDKEYLNLEHLQRKYPLTYDDLGALLTFASNTCNMLLRNMSQSVFVTQSGNIQDVCILLDKLAILRRTGGTTL